MDKTELWAALASVAAVILPLIFNSEWWRNKTGQTGKIVAAAATAAVAAQNRERVDADRASDSGEGVGKVSDFVGATAKKNAVTDALAAIAHATKTPQGDLVAEIVYQVPGAVEAAVQAVKKARNPELNKVSAARLPGLLLFFFVLLSLSACSTLPKGWTESNADDWDRVATKATVVVYGPEASTLAPVPSLAAVGRAGSITYQAMRETKVDKGLCAAAAVKAMEIRAQREAPPLADYAAIAAAVFDVCSVPANETDQLLGLMVGALRTPVQPPPK